jgi:hypothetical protein
MRGLGSPERGLHATERFGLRALHVTLIAHDASKLPRSGRRSDAAAVIDDEDVRGFGKWRPLYRSCSDDTPLSH